MEAQPGPSYDAPEPAGVDHDDEEEGEEYDEEPTVAEATAEVTPPSSAPSPPAPSQTRGSCTAAPMTRDRAQSSPLNP